MQTREAAQFTIECRQPCVEEVDGRERHLDELASGRRELGRAQPLAAGAIRELTADRDALMEQLRVHALQPGASLLSERLTQADAAAQLEQVRRRDPRAQQLAAL